METTITADTTYTIGGHDYYAHDDGHVTDGTGVWQGVVFKSACGEYWHYENGETGGGMIHENEPNAFYKAVIALATSNY